MALVPRCCAPALPERAVSPQFASDNLLPMLPRLSVRLVLFSPDHENRLRDRRLFVIAILPINPRVSRVSSQEIGFRDYLRTTLRAHALEEEKIRGFQRLSPRKLLLSLHGLENVTTAGKDLSSASAFDRRKAGEQTEES